MTKTKKIIVISIALFCAILLAAILYEWLAPIKILRSYPDSTTKTISFQPYFMLELNRNVQARSVSVSCTPLCKPIVRQKGKAIDITFREDLQKNQDYVFMLAFGKPVTIQDGSKIDKISWRLRTTDLTIEQMEDTNLSGLIETDPLVQYLPFENDHFIISIPDNDGYLITLLAILNGSSDPDADLIKEQNYRQELKQFKQEALDWIWSKNIDPAKLQIRWSPEEAEEA